MPCARSHCPIEFTFFDYSIIRLISALDAILVVATLRGQKLHDLEHAAAPAAPVRSGRVLHRLPDLELVAAHIVTKGFTWNGTTKMASGTPAYLRTTSGSSAIFAANRREIAVLLFVPAFSRHGV